MGNDKIEFEVTKTWLGWVSLLLVAMSILVLLAILSLVFYIGPQIALAHRGAVPEMKNIEYLWMVFGGYVLCCVIGVIFFLIAKSIESVAITDDFCERKTTMRRTHRIYWKDLIAVRYRVYLACIELRTVDDVIRIYNVFSDSDAAVAGIFRRIPEDTPRCYLAKQLEVDLPHSKLRCAFRSGVPYNPLVLYMMRNTQSMKSEGRHL